jgi:hypothetical protein
MELVDTTNLFRTCVGIVAQPSSLFMKNALSLSQEEIALRAYHLFVDGGCQHGRDVEYWLQAEKELGAKFFTAPSSNGKSAGAGATFAPAPKKPATKVAAPAAEKPAAAKPAAEKPAATKKAPAKKAAAKKKKASE